MSYQIRPSTPADYPGIVAIINADATEPTSVEALERSDQRRRPEDAYLRLAATDDTGTLLGYGFARPDPTFKTGHGYIRVLIDPQHRDQGIGTALESRLAEWAAAAGLNALEADVEAADTAACAWTEGLGYQREYQLYESTLALAGWDPTPCAGALARAQADGYRLTTAAAEAEGDELLRRLYDVVMAPNLDIPGWEGRPQPSLELWSGWVKANPYHNPEAIFLAVKGDEWVGVSEVHVLESGRAWNSFTGVKREHRGHGLALALKVMALDWTKAQGVAEIITENHSLNEPMLAVNRKLGYVPHPGTFHLCRQLV